MDARYEKVRVGGRVVSQGVLIVSGVREEGFREILAVEVADTESEATYQELFRSLKRRGLRGVELVVSDDHEGLKAAVAHHFQGTRWQRCQVHYARNLLGMVAMPGAKSLPRTRAVCSPHRAGRWLLGSLPSRRPGGAGATPGSLRTSKGSSRNAFPESHRGRIRTTNGLERLRARR